MSGAGGVCFQKCLTAFFMVNWGGFRVSVVAQNFEGLMFQSLLG